MTFVCGGVDLLWLGSLVNEITAVHIIRNKIVTCVITFYELSTRFTYLAHVAGDCVQCCVLMGTRLSVL